MKRRRKRRNPSSDGSYWVGFGLAASALIVVLFAAKKLAGAPSQLPAPRD